MAIYNDYHSLLVIRILSLKKNTIEMMGDRLVNTSILEVINKVLKNFELDTLEIFDEFKSVRVVVGLIEFRRIFIERIYNSINIEMMKKFRVTKLSLKMDIIRIPVVSNKYLSNDSRSILETRQKIPVMLTMIQNELLQGKSNIEIIPDSRILTIYNLFTSGVDIDIMEHKILVQPKVNIIDYIPKGGESLSRLNYKDGTVITPDIFIPVLTKTNKMNIFDITTIKKSLDYIQSNEKIFNKDNRLSVNLSLSNFQDDAIIDTLIRIFSKYTQKTLMSLEIEITEYDQFTDDLVENLIKAEKVLSNTGVTLSLDDVGAMSGHSNFTLLNHVNFSKVKIDKSMTDCLNNDRGYKLMKSMYSFCDTIGSEVIVEGVEEYDQIERLKQIGVKEVQGFFFSKPLDKNDYIKFVNNKKL